MGSKRPDQYAIDAGEANAKDNETLSGPAPQIEEKQKLAQSRAEATRESFIPQGGKNPALADLQQRREQRQEEQERKSADAGDDRPAPSGEGKRDQHRGDAGKKSARRSRNAGPTE